MYFYIKPDTSIIPQKASATCIFKEKPQIKSIPGIGAKEKHRYRVILGGRILGDKLSLEQALAAAGLEAKGGVA